jgi:hypothetical protein
MINKYFFITAALINQAFGNINILRQRVACPFALKAKIWKPNFRWNSEHRLKKNIEQFKTLDLDPYIEQPQPYDVIPLELPSEQYAKDIPTLAATLKSALSTLNKQSIEELKDLKPDNNGRYWYDGWQFSYRDTRFFITTFAPFYRANSSRYNYGLENAIILFQQEQLLRDSLPADQQKRNNRKLLVRELFAKRGQSYTNNKTIEPGFGQKAHEAPRYIKPLPGKTEVIRWWK